MGALRPIKLKFTKKDRAAAIDSLKMVLYAGQEIVFLHLNSNEYDWVILALDSAGAIAGITRPIAGLLSRPYVDGVLRGIQYDSPHIILDELQHAIEYPEPFRIGEATWL